MYKVQFALVPGQTIALRFLEIHDEQESLLYRYGEQPDHEPVITALMSRPSVVALTSQVFGRSFALAEDDLSHAERTAREIEFERRVGLIEIEDECLDGRR